MKKNFAMRVAACLLVVTMLSLCMVSYTYAKFVTTGSGHDEARVAKWGVVIDLADFDMFDTEYDGTVKSGTTDKLVAPGTSGELLYTGLSGKPEVKVEVNFTSNLTLTGWDASGYYCPLEIKVGTTVFKGNDYSSIAEFEAIVEAAINDYSAEYAVNTDLSSVAAPVVSWEWTYSGNDDVKDTALGDAAAQGNPSTVKLELVITVTQLN